jgi:hypothetical protein
MKEYIQKKTTTTTTNKQTKKKKGTIVLLDIKAPCHTCYKEINESI